MNLPFVIMLVLHSLWLLAFFIAAVFIYLLFGTPLTGQYLAAVLVSLTAAFVSLVLLFYLVFRIKTRDALPDGWSAMNSSERAERVIAIALTGSWRKRAK